MANFACVDDVIDHATGMSTIVNLASDTATDSDDHKPAGVHAPADVPCCGRYIVKDMDVSSGATREVGPYIRKLGRLTSNSWCVYNSKTVRDRPRKRKHNRGGLGHECPDVIGKVCDRHKNVVPHFMAWETFGKGWDALAF
jgi:hypothetical protein